MPSIAVERTLDIPLDIVMVCMTIQSMIPQFKIFTELILFMKTDTIL